MRYATKIRTLILTLLFASVALSPPEVRSQVQDAGDKQKLAQTAFKFLSLSVHPRAAALGDAVNTLRMGAPSMFYNPAGMTGLNDFGHFAAGNMQWIADINYNQASISLRPKDGKFGTFGVLARFVDYGEVEGTIRADNEQGFIETGAVNPGAFSIGIGYANALTDRVSVGGTVKFVQEDLGDSVVDASGATKSNTFSTAAFDFGVIYDSGFRGVTFAMSARNFSPAVDFEQNTFDLPLEISADISADLVRLVNPQSPLNENHSFRLTAGGMTPRDFNEQVRVGGEYAFMDSFFLRGGYSSPFGNTTQGMSLGAGVQLPLGDNLEIGADYAYQQQDNFDGVNRVAIDIQF